MSVLSARRKQVAVAIEATEGSEESLAAADAGFYVFDLGFTPNIEQNERLPFRDSIGSIPSIPGVRSGEMNFETELVGSGDLTTVLPFDALLRACGMEVISPNPPSGVTARTFNRIKIDTGTAWTGGTSAQIDATASQGGVSGSLAMTVHEGDAYLFVYDVTSGPFLNSSDITVGGVTIPIDSGEAVGVTGYYYRPANGDFESVTVGEFIGPQTGTSALKNLLTGARGSVSFEFKTGDRVRMALTMQGALGTPSDATLLSGITFPSNTPPNWLNALLRLHDEGSGPYAPCADAMSLNLNNNIEARLCANQASGIQSYVIVDRAGSGNVDPELVNVADHNFFNRMFKQTARGR